MSIEKELIVSTLQEIEENMELFYQQKNGQALDRFNIILGKMATMLDTLFAYRNNHPDFLFDEERIKNTLMEAMKALEESDMILLADIIQYDFVDYLKELLNNIE